MGGDTFPVAGSETFARLVEDKRIVYLVDLTATPSIDGADVGQPSIRFGDQEIVKRDRRDGRDDWGVHSFVNPWKGG
jgi:hypothetical protein